MSTFLDVPYAIQLALLFVLIATKAWRKSYSTLLFMFATLILLYKEASCPPDIYIFMVNAISFIAVTRAMASKENDKLIKG